MSGKAKVLTDEPAYRFIPNDDSRTLLLCFGGVAGQLGMREFESNRITSDLRVNRIMLKDPLKKFYLAGIPGLGDTVRKSVANLKVLAARASAERIVCFGNSMGGFGAILYGALLGADRIQAFKARTTVQWSQLLRIKDKRRLDWLLRLNLTYPSSWPYLDLRRVLRRHPSGKGWVDSPTPVTPKEGRVFVERIVPDRNELALPNLKWFVEPLEAVFPPATQATAVAEGDANPAAEEWEETRTGMAPCFLLP